MTRKVARRSRRPDPIWDCVADIWYEGIVPEDQYKFVGLLVKKFKARKATPMEIKKRLGRYRQRMPDMMDTPTALLNHWGSLAVDPPAKDGRTNRRMDKYEC